MQRQYTAIYQKDCSWFIGMCAEIPGCITQGKTLASCRNNLKDAIRLMVDVTVEELTADLEQDVLVEGIEVGETKQIAKAIAKYWLQRNPRRRQTHNLACSKRNASGNTKTQGVKRTSCSKHYKKLDKRRNQNVTTK